VKKNVKLWLLYYRTSATNVPTFIDPKSRKAPAAQKYPHVYDMNFESKVSSCKFFYNFNFKFMFLHDVLFTQ